MCNHDWETLDFSENSNVSDLEVDITEVPEKSTIQGNKMNINFNPQPTNSVFVIIFQLSDDVNTHRWIIWESFPSDMNAA